MDCGRHRGFTLVEMLVVISLIGILAAALVTQVTKVRETARAVKCKANLKNLAQAALSFAVDKSYMPAAGSYEYPFISGKKTGSRTGVHLERGWVDWTRSETIETWDKDYDGRGASFSGGTTMQTAMEGRAAFLSVTNGALWAYMGRELSTYVCDAHVAAYKKANSGSRTVFRSYVMNAYFGYNYAQRPANWHRVWLNNLSDRGSSERLLLFGELAITQIHNNAARAGDGVLETKIVDYNDGTGSSPLKEALGFNHLVGKQAVAHVAYADGHVDVFHMRNASGLTDAQQLGLVYYLCNGYDLPQETSDWKVP